MASTLKEALSIFKDAKRTCEYYYVISDAKIPDARGIYATPKQIHFVKPGENYAMFDIPAPRRMTAAENHWCRLQRGFQPGTDHS